MMTMGFKAEGETIMYVGSRFGHLGQSLWLRELHNREDGPPPDVDLEELAASGALLRTLVSDGLITAIHDVSGGGLGVALAKMALAGNIGADLNLDAVHRLHAEVLFAETQATFVFTTSDVARTYEHLTGFSCGVLGKTGGDGLRITVCDTTSSQLDISLADLRAAHEGTLPALMAR